MSRSHHQPLFRGGDTDGFDGEIDEVVRLHQEDQSHVEGVRPELALNAGRAAREICVRTEPLRD